MGFGLQWVINKITFPSPPSSYSLTSHPELFFVRSPKGRPGHPGVPCMLYAVPQGAPVLLVHAHSNGCDIGDMRQTLQSISESLRVHVMSFEFPGYGLHVGSASQRAIDEAADAVLNFIMNDLQINISQVVWYGRSIGSGATVAMCNRITKELGRTPGGCILQCGYANFPEVAGHLFGVVAKQLVCPLWRNEAMLKEVRCPVLLIHGRNDTMIPLEQSEKLWNAVYQKGKATLQIKIAVGAGREVEVGIVSAKALASCASQSARLPSAYCRLCVRGQEFRTHAVKDSPSPAWDFRASVPNGAVGDVLEFEVWDEQPEPQGDELLCRTALELNQRHLASGPGAAVTELDLDLADMGAMGRQGGTASGDNAAGQPRLAGGRASESSQNASQKPGWRSKGLSHFYTCDCGHNDFNFRRCTLRPIYDFLLGVISAEGYPPTNFTMEVAASNNTFVHHIGPLRTKIPVYGFRRPELDEWMRNLVKSRAASSDEDVVNMDSGDWCDATLRPGLRVQVRPGASVGAAGFSGQQGVLEAYDSGAGTWSLALAGGERVSLRPEDLMTEGSYSALKEGRPNQEGKTPKSSPGSPPGKKSGKDSSADADGAAAKGKKDKKGAALPPPIPDFTELPAIEDASIALSDSEGLVRTCALRVAAYLDRVQRQLDRVEGLESKPLEEVVRLVEAEFWACDPVLCLWEEVSLPRGDRVRLRLGPFSIDSSGERSYDPSLGCDSTSSPNTLRAPLWIFAPSPAHFRCLAEWSLLQSDRLRRSLPTAVHAHRGGGCCCVPSHRLTKRRKGKGEGNQQPTRGVLATSLAAHFVNWVEKTDEVRNLFAKFVSLYNNPGDTLRRSSASWAAKEPAPSATGASASSTSRRAPASADERGGPPWLPLQFSSAARATLREGIGAPGGVLADLHALQRGAMPQAPDGGEEEPAEESESRPNVVDFRTMAGIISDAAAAEEHKSTEWMVAGQLLHYERLLWGYSPESGETCPSEEAWGDPLRPSVQESAAALNRVVQAFSHAENRERRECQRQRLRQMTRPPSPQRSAAGEPVPAPETKHLEEATQPNEVNPPSGQARPDAPDSS